MGSTRWDGTRLDEADNQMCSRNEDARVVAGVMCTIQLEERLRHSVKTRFCSCIWDWWDSKRLVRQGAMRHLSRQSSHNFWCVSLCATRACEV